MQVFCPVVQVILPYLRGEKTLIGLMGINFILQGLLAQSRELSSEINFGGERVSLVICRSLPVDDKF